MISVILATYNRRALLEEALASVFGQTHGDIEVIVVDDGSTDDTLDDLRQFANRLTVIGLPHSGKPAIARNVGLARARGEFIALLDSDDTWEPTALAELKAALNTAPDAGFSFSDYAYGENQVSVRGRADGSLPQGLYERLLDTNFLVTGGLLIRREAIQTVGAFDERCTVAYDWDYWLRLAAQYEGIYVQRSLVRIRVYDDSISRAPGGIIFRDNERIGRKVVAWCRLHRPQSLPRAKQLARRSLRQSAGYHWRQHAYLPMARDLLALAFGR